MTSFRQLPGRLPAHSRYLSSPQRLGGTLGRLCIEPPDRPVESDTSARNPTVPKHQSHDSNGHTLSMGPGNGNPDAREPGAPQ